MDRPDYEAMRRDPANWKFGIVYVCRDDPRVVVANPGFIGWTWNFGHRRVWPAIFAAIAVFFGAPALLWSIGVRAPLALIGAAVAVLVAIACLAHRAARDPNA